MSDKTRAIVRGIADTYDQALSVYFGTGPTDVEEAKRQHATYVSSLRKFGVEVKELSTDNDYPDCCFVEDQVSNKHRSSLSKVLGRVGKSGSRLRPTEPHSDLRVSKACTAWLEAAIQGA